MIDDRPWMERAVANAARIRHSTSPNPWVGAVVVAADGGVFDGATEPPGGRHAERVALDEGRLLIAGPCPATDESLRLHCRELLAGYKTPRHWRRVDALPVNAAGKVDKALLRRQFGP